MRKLLLASYQFKTGEIRYNEHRLIAIDSTPTTPFEEDQKKACDIFEDWFNQTARDQQFLGVQCHPTIDGTKFGESKPVNTAHLVHPLTEFPELRGNEDENISRTVVIDTDGNKKHFVIGWYDFDDKLWITQVDIKLNKKHAKWMDILPID